MERAYKIELLLANEQGRHVCKLIANYPGDNSFVAVLNFFHGIAGNVDCVDLMSQHRILRMSVNGLRSDMEHTYGNIKIREVPR